MVKKYVDLWKYPHMSYKQAFAIATVISIGAVGITFTSFSEYIASHMTGPIHVNFLTEQEADKVVEEVKEQIQEEQKQQEVVRPNNANTAGGAGKGGQNGSSNTPTKSDITPSSQKASAGEASSVKSSAVGTTNGDGLKGEEGPGMGNAQSGEGQGFSDQEGDGGTESGVGGGTFDPNGYRVNLQAYVDGNYPSQAVRMGITGTVVLLVTFGPDGEVLDVDVQYSDDSILSDHAKAAARSIGGAENSTGEVRTATVTLVYQLD